MIFGGGSWKTPINNVMDVLNDGDGKAYEELMPPYYKDMACLLYTSTGSQTEIKSGLKEGDEIVIR